MKQIPILSGRFLVLEIPEGATDYHVCNVDGHESFSCYFIRTHTVDLPPGNWRIIGMLSEVTEEQARTLCEHEWFINKGDVLNNDELRFTDYSDGSYPFFKALESLESAILAEGYYLDENPIEHPSQSDPKFYDEPYDGTGFYQEIYSSAINDWQQAQSRVLDRSRCLLLGREQ